MEVYTFFKVFLVLIFLLNCFDYIFGTDEIPSKCSNKALVPKVDENIVNNCSKVYSSLRKDRQSKFRRKRYVAFPEGSSFSVKCLISVLKK